MQPATCPLLDKLASYCVTHRHGNNAVPVAVLVGTAPIKPCTSQSPASATGQDRKFCRHAARGDKATVPNAQCRRGPHSAHPVIAASLRCMSQVPQMTGLSHNTPTRSGHSMCSSHACPGQHGPSHCQHNTSDAPPQPPTVHCCFLDMLPDARTAAPAACSE
jgi:hypothetical protein